jgi:hypothetical protein
VRASLTLRRVTDRFGWSTSQASSFLKGGYRLTLESCPHQSKFERFGKTPRGQKDSCGAGSGIDVFAPINFDANTRLGFTPWISSARKRGSQSNWTALDMATRPAERETRKKNGS